MTIKKIPICPFCGYEMKQQPGIYREGAIITTEKKFDEEHGHDRAVSTVTLSIFKCEHCKFIALWGGEP